MQYNELGALSDEALVHKELQLERDLLEMRFRLSTNQLENTSAIRAIRRDIARIRTAQRSREREQGLSVDVLRNRHRGSFRAVSGGQLGKMAAAGASFLKGLSEKLGSEDEAEATE